LAGVEAKTASDLEKYHKKRLC